MSQDELICELQKMFDQCIEIVRKKNTDYADKNSDAFKNFRLIEQIGVCTTEEGFITRMTDKLSRIGNLIKKPPAVVEESLEDTLLDLINYTALLRVFIKNKKNKEEK